MTYAVIMAGGVGSRFWPRSRAKTPKQLLNIFGDRTMIQQTVDRIAGMISSENTMIVTNILQAEEIRKQLTQLRSENILIEPVGRNTAPCIGLAAVHILKKDPQGIMAVLAADHLIRNPERFREQLEFAAGIAERSETCVTLGIHPDRPVTGYGYIRFDPDQSQSEKNCSANKVIRFVEKPDIEKAEQYIRSGEYLWNSGMFVWKASTIMNLIRELLPDLYRGLEVISRGIGTPDYEQILQEVYHQLKPISIDYGVMERTREVWVVKSDFGWSDVGSWEEVYQLLNHDEYGNAVPLSHTLIRTRNSFFSTGKHVAAIGIENLILVETEDAILLCRREDAQDVKKIADELEKNNNRKLL